MRQLTGGQPPNGVTGVYTYNSAGRLVGVVYSKDANTLASYQYAYDPNGNRLQATENILWVNTGAFVPPAQFSAIEQGFMSITLSWPDSTIEEEGYTLERSTDGQNWQPLAELSANTLRYVDYGLARHTSYWYRLTAHNSLGGSEAHTLQTETGWDAVTDEPRTPGNVTVDYVYDALNRLAGATYSDGTDLHYTYDPAGNALTYTSTIAGQTTSTTYTYDAANQLLTAVQGGITWHYTYDGNGSLTQANPGPSTTSGSKRYSYSVAGFLTKVELYDGSTWQPQAEMAYDGLGNRLEMTAHAEGQSVTTRYVLDGSQVLAAIAGANSTFYLYGHGPLAELTDAWAYPLVDGSRTARQLVDASGEVVLASSYTPWGDTLSVSGSGSFLTGSFGGIMDSATGLLYLGDGQYYDPATGRFLNRNARPNQANPYVPWSGDPLGAMMAPLAVMTVVLGRRKKHGKWEITVVLLALVFTAGLSFTACTFTTNGYEITITPNSTNPQEYNVTATPITDSGRLPAFQATITPTKTLTQDECSDPQHTIPNARLIAARIYYEGGSTYNKGSNSADDPGKTLFIRMVYAVKSLHDRFAPASDYEVFTRYDNPAGRKLLSIANPNCAATQNANGYPGNPGYCRLASDDLFSGSELDFGLPSYAEEIVNQVYSDSPCAPLNPFLPASDSFTDGIHWLSPTIFPRVDVQTDINPNNKYMLVMQGVRGCESGEGCQHNDIRERPNFEAESGELKSFRMEELIGFIWDYSKNVLQAPQDEKGNTECYWRGIYFFSNSHFNTAQIRSQLTPSHEDYMKERFLCPKN